MSGTEELKASVLEQAHQEGQAKFEAAKKQLETEFEERKAQLLTQKASERQSRLKEIKQAFQVEAQQISNQERQSTLVSKQKVLSDLFASALERMRNWDADQELAFIKGLLAKYGQEKVTVQFGQLTADRLTAAHLAQLRTAFPNMTFMSESIDQQAGLLVSVGKVDDTYLYDSLIDSIYKEESSRIATDIFAQG